MSLRKIDESNVDVEPYTLNKKLFNEMIEFRVRKIFLFLPFLVSMKTGRKRDGRWSHQFKSSPSPLCTIQRRDSHRGRCRRDVIRWGGGRDVPGLSSFCEDYTGPFLSLHPSKGMEIRAYIRSRKRRVRVVCDRLTRTGSVERVIK